MINFASWQTKSAIKTPQRHLTAKAITFGLARAQPEPDSLLGFGHLAAECLGLLAGPIAWLLLHMTSIVT
jgi:hypothetical protein